MMPIKKILVPTDFSQQAVSAYIQAQEIADRFGATIDLVHIIPTLKYFNESLLRLDAPLDPDEELYPTVQKEAKHKLEESMKDYVNETSRGKEIVKIGRKPSDRIAELAEEGNYDLIVMASKGGDTSELLRGGTTEKVIRHSQVPVYAVDDGLTSTEVKRILFPTDGSDISFSALPLALTMAEIYQAELNLFHVVELYGDPLQNESRDSKKSEKENIYNNLMGRLEKYLSDHSENVRLERGESNYRDQLVITDGEISTTIDLYTDMEKGFSAHLAIEEFASNNADIVVMATHGYSGFAHFFMGSTAEKVVQHLQIPVLTVKPAKEKLREKES